jgi:hypothetical protein
MTIENPRPGTPKSGGYAMDWGIVRMDWCDAELLTHDGSNGMNLAKVAIDLDKDFAAVMATNIGGDGAKAALSEVVEHLFRGHGGGSR